MHNLVGKKELKVETTQNMLLLCRKSINMISAMPKTGGACLQKNEKYYKFYYKRLTINMIMKVIGGFKLSFL